MRSLLVLWLLLSLAAEALPSAVEQALRQAKAVEILSLHPVPNPLKPGPTSGGFSVLGHALLGPEEERLVCAAVLKGLEEGEQEGGSLPGCFDPRHALRFGDLDIVICYSCHRWNAFERGVEIGGGRITQPGSQECERAVIQHGLDWQGWAELDNRFFHASGFSITFPPYLKVGRRGKDEILQPTVSVGTVITRFPGKTEGWFTRGESMSFDSPVPLGDFYERLRREIPGVVGELDSGSNQLEVFVSGDTHLYTILTLLSPEDPERVLLYPLCDIAAARSYVKELKADVERIARLKESSPGVWTGASPGHFQAVVLLEREGSYLVCHTYFKCDEASGRQRLEELLSTIRFRAPIGRP